MRINNKDIEILNRIRDKAMADHDTIEKDRTIDYDRMSAMHRERQQAIGAILAKVHIQHIEQQQIGMPEVKRIS